MTNNYQDKYTMYHDKPTTLGNPSSNNGWIYTSYSKYLAPNTIDKYLINKRFIDCIGDFYEFRINRLPNKPYPPFSKDELIGCISLGLINIKALESVHWNFCNLDYKKEPLTLRKALKAAKILFDIRNEHRNYVWENNLTDAYCLAFYTPLEVQYYIKKMFGKKPNLFNKAAFYINLISCLTKADKSSRMLMLQMLSDLDHFALKFINKDKWVRDYFPEDHPFVQNLKEN